MCGFFFTNRSGIEKKDVMEQLSQRGSDDLNFIILKGLVLAHSRLMLSGSQVDGNQPFRIDDSNYLLYNGEIYSFGKFGEKASNESDTSYLAKLLSHHEFCEVIPELDGMYSIAMININSGEILVARDRFGQKPLYYSFYNGKIILSSSSYLCAKYSNEYFKLSKNSLSQYFAFGFVVTNSIYDGVYEVPPSNIGSYNGSDFDFKQFHTNYEVLGINDAIDKSICKTISTNYDVALALSGGIDSTAIASYYKRNNIRPSVAITVSSKSKEFDESNVAHATAKKCNFELLFVKPDRNSIIEAEFEVLRLLEEPISDSGLVPNYLLAKSARASGAKVLVTGDGGDEIFGGYNRHALFSSINGNSCVSILKRNFLKFLPRDILQRLLKHTHYGAGSLVQRLDVLYNSLQTKSSTEFIATALSGLPASAALTELLHSTIEINGQNHEYKKLLDLDRSIYLKGNNLYRSDRISLGLGVEARAPLLNSIVADNVHIEHYNSKLLLRSYIKYNGLDYLPPPKKGFNISAPPSITSEEVSNLLNLLRDCCGFSIDQFRSSPYFSRRCYYLKQWFSARSTIL